MRMFEWVVVFGVLFIVGAGVGVYALGGIPGVWQRHRLEGVFAPAYDPAGAHLYFIHRTTRGTSSGPGWEHFTPPARAGASRDAFSLRRLDLESGEVEVLESWPVSPLVGRSLSTYRGRLFTVAAARLRVGADAVEYDVRLSVPRVPRSDPYRLSGSWSPNGGDPGAWEEGHAQISGYGETRLNGRWEAMTVGGPESYPSAIVAFDEGTGEVVPLVTTPAFERSHPEGVSVDGLRERSKRAEIERIAHLRDTREALLERFRGEGRSEMEAALAATREMQRMGLYPRPTTLSARPLADDERRSDDVPHFVIPEGEMRSGVFPDIERALADPGTEVEKSLGAYVIHRDYENSARLNEYFGGGGLVLYVTYGGATYELTVRPSGRGQAGGYAGS